MTDGRGDTFAGYAFALRRGAGRGHVCNCVGCCPSCGGCRTNPTHTDEHCRRVAAWRQAAPGGATATPEPYGERFRQLCR